MNRKKFGAANEPTAEIISYADSRYYLVAISEAGSNLPDLVRDRKNKAITFRGLVEAKQWLKRRGYKQAELRMETAYDDMTGPPSPPATIVIPLIH